MGVAAKTEPRPFQKEWIGEHYPLETRYGVITIQPLGWGVRAWSRRGTEYVNGERVWIEDPPLRINGREGMLGWVDYPIGQDASLGEPRGVTGGNLTENAEAKMLAELAPLVRAWLIEHASEFAATRAAYLSDRARTCEESIRELEDALDVYRERLRLIEAGDMDVSPYLNGGRRLMEAS